MAEKIQGETLTDRQKYDFKRDLETIKNLKGRGTELISVYVPPTKQISDVSNYLREEFSQASNIKSQGTRKNVQGAIQSILARLKYFKTPPANGVVFFDLTCYDLEGYNKFIPYYLFPDSVYTVSVSRSSFRTKVSVGSNPWSPKPLVHNLATICERYGGGGHPRVGAISFDLGAVDAARKAASEIVQELQE